MMQSLEKQRAELEKLIAEIYEGEKKVLVHGEGSLKPRLMLIGEAPGEQETLQRRPFVGKAGKNLDEFLELALLWDLPAMLHLRDKENSRQVYQDALDMLTPFSQAGGRFVIHCYAGNAADAEKFLELGGYFGAGGMYTFKAAGNIRDALAVVPTERLLIETDSPYLTPVPYRGKSNTPGMVALVARALGIDRQMLPEKAAEVFTGNAIKFYRIGDLEI